MNGFRRALAASIATAALCLSLAGMASGAVVVVNLSNAQFSDTTVDIQLNDTVVFVNQDSFAHDVTFEAGFGSGGSGSLAPGANWSHTFTTAGTFKFRCLVHSTNYDTGMVGRVAVAQGSAPPPPATPGFELGAALAAVAAVALLARRRMSP